jgi:hypothetical protein
LFFGAGAAGFSLSASISRLIASISASMLSSSSERCTGIHLLAAPIEAPALQDRHLVRELVDLQLFGFEFFVRALGEFGELSVAVRSRS